MTDESRWTATFDSLFERGRAAVLAGSHHRDSPPVNGGRWGLSVVLRPDGASEARMAAIADEALRVAGPAHWPTGAPEAVHLTVRAIEAHRSPLPAGDPLVARSGAALARAARDLPPIGFALRGLTLTPSGVMTCAYPVDPTADEFASRLGDELGDDDWFEADFNRNIWYATLVHFAGPVADPTALVEWVAARRQLSLGTVEVTAAELVRFHFNGRQPVRVALAACRLGQPARDV
ncbi:hypothetical protein [Plantactinospora sonchi]|uniref:2'-5' RNA ligase family protein n=1 Tax=Plantactinospora sonchi TaxID=1544735 RepID=A0ABU7RNL2_9ACTN